MAADQIRSRHLLGHMSGLITSGGGAGLRGGLNPLRLERKTTKGGFHQLYYEDNCLDRDFLNICF